MVISLEAVPLHMSAVLEILQNSQENTCAGFLFLITLQAEKSCKIYWKKPALDSSKFKA